MNLRRTSALETFLVFSHGVTSCISSNYVTDFFLPWSISMRIDGASDPISAYAD